MRWIWALALMAGCGGGAGDVTDAGDGGDETAGSIPGATTSRGGTTKSPAPIVETHECPLGDPLNHQVDYPFEWATTIEVDEPVQVGVWAHLSGWYRDYLKNGGENDGSPVDDAAVPVAVYVAAVPVLANGHAQGACTWMTASGGDADPDADWKYDQFTLIVQ